MNRFRSSVRQTTGSRSRARRFVPWSVTVSAALVAAACSSSSHNGATSNTQGSTSGATSAGSGAGSSAGFTLSSPVTLGFLWEVKGESSVAIDDYQNGALMAINQINSAGGVGGKPVQWFREPSNPLDPQANLSDFLQAVGKKPAAMIGLAAPTQEEQLAGQITRAAIPVINTDTGDSFSANGTSGGSPYSWFIGPYNPGLVSAAIGYMTGSLHLSKIGLMGTNESYGNEGVQSAASALKAKGLKPFATGQYSPVATDLTQQVLQMKGADGVFDWGYPNPIAVQLNQFVQNGIDIPTMSSVSVDVAISGGLVKGQALSNLYVAQPCDLNAPGYSPKLATFVSAYKAKYGNVPSQNAAWAYDGVMLAVAAINAAKSDSPSAINKELGSITYAGTCGTYQADGANVLSHQAVISKYSSAGTDQVVAQPTIQTEAKGA